MPSEKMHRLLPGRCGTVRRLLQISAITSFLSYGCTPSNPGRSVSNPGRSVSNHHSFSWKAEPKVGNETSHDAGIQEIAQQCQQELKLVHFEELGRRSGTATEKTNQIFSFSDRVVSETVAHPQQPSAPAERSPRARSFPELLESTDASPVAESSPTPLPELIATALSRHPRIVAARQRVSAAANRIPQAQALPDPNFSNTFWPLHEQSLQTAGGRVGNQMGLNQQIPWPAKLSAKAAVAAREVQVARAEVALVEREIIEAVKIAYYQLWLANALIDVVDANKELVRDLVAVSEARYQAGGSQQDVLRAELENDKLDDRLIELRLQREEARAELGTLLQRPTSLMPVAVDELDLADAAPRLEQLVADAERCNPTLQGLSAEIARDRERVRLSCLQQYPDLNLGVGWWLINDNNEVLSGVANGHDAVNFTVGVSLPVYRDKINAGIREAIQQQGSTINERRAERDQVRGQLRRLVATASASAEQLQLFRDRLIPRTEQTLEITTADYQVGKADFLDLVDLFRELLAYEVQVARSKAVLAETFARIERAVGCPLQ